MTIINGNQSLPHVKDAAWLADRARRLASFKPDCRHGNDPGQCATCLKERGVKLVEPDRAAVTAPRVMPPIPSIAVPEIVYRECAQCGKSFAVEKPYRAAIALCSGKCVRARNARAPVTRGARRVPPKGETMPELVMAALRASGQPVFTREDIVVLAFRAYPAKFGMRTYPELPDSARVYSLLDDERGLVKRGWLVKTNDGYELPRV